MEGPTVARGEQLWQPYMVRGNIGGTVFGPAEQLAAWTTYGMTGPHAENGCKTTLVCKECMGSVQLCNFTSIAF